MATLLESVTPVVASRKRCIAGGPGWLIFYGIWLLAYRKKIVFDLRTQRVEVMTRTIFRGFTESFASEEVKIQAEEIHIRLAEGCGVVYLVLPGYKIRLSVFGSYQAAQNLADVLQKRMGIAENFKKR